MPVRRRGSLARRLAQLCELDLGEAALIASGAKYRRQLIAYLGKLSRLERRLISVISLDLSDVEKARAVFDCLWQSKPHRYLSQGNSKLTDVIDAQLGEEEVVGNCLGLTLLYNSLGQRFGIPLKALHLDSAFCRGPHVLSLLPAHQGDLDIENVFPQGFGYPGHLANPGRTEWGNRDLIGELLVAVGNEKFEDRRLEEALESYEAALVLSPQNQTAQLNRLIVLAELGRDAP
ncbi:MAG: hypothetical protein ABIH46_05905 [Chloroflexota bacterium]